MGNKYITYRTKVGLRVFELELTEDRKRFKMKINGSTVLEGNWSGRDNLRHILERAVGDW